MGLSFRSGVASRGGYGALLRKGRGAQLRQAGRCKSAVRWRARTSPRTRLAQAITHSLTCSWVANMPRQEDYAILVLDFPCPSIWRIATEDPGARFSRQASRRLQVS